MAKIKTINTIELSSLCNLSCSYCIQPQLKDYEGREAQLMTMETFEAALKVLEKTVEAGTQAEVNLNGNGESLLNPDLVEMVRRVREVVGPERTVKLTSNGLLLTTGIARALKDAGLSAIDISVHSPKYARKAVNILRGIPLNGTLAIGAILYPHDWAGQVDDGVKYCGSSIPCDPLMAGYAYIQAEGTISPCCYDFKNLGTFGTVHDADIMDREYGRYALCDSCHQLVPGNVPRGTTGHGSRVFQVAL